MGLLTFMKSSQKGKEKQVRASTFTVAPAVSITQPRTQVEPEAPDTRVLETLGECASTTATAVEVDFSTALRSPASSSRRQSIASAASGGTAPSVHAPVAQQGENPNPSPNLSPEVIEEEEDEEDDQKDNGQPLATFSHAWVGSAAREEEEYDLSKLAELVGADKDNSYGFQTVGGEPSSRPLKTLKAEYEEDFYVPAFGRDNRNGGFR